MSQPIERQGLKQTQQLLVTALAFGLYGISLLVAEWLPPLLLGPFELSMEYSFFLPLILCIFFHPFYGAAGAALAELMIGGMVFGHFEGFMMIGRFLAVFGALWVGGMMVNAPRDRKQVAWAAFAVVIIYQSANALLNLILLAGSAEKLSAVPGLMQLLIMMEGLIFFEAVLVSGLFYTILPAVMLVPYIFRKSRRRLAGSSVRLTQLKTAKSN